MGGKCVLCCVCLGDAMLSFQYLSMCKSGRVKIRNTGRSQALVETDGGVEMEHVAGLDRVMFS